MSTVVMVQVMSPDALKSVAASVQPLIFETGLPDYPYTTGGTAFMVGYEGRVFALTARHCLNPDRLGPLCIVPSDLSQRMLPLKDVFFVSSQWMSEEYTDLAAIEIDLTRRLDAELGCARIIDLARASGEWRYDAHVSDFVVIGYPSERSAVDYEHETIETGRFALRGKYVGSAPQPFTHEMEILDTLSLSSLDGFSGGPVFAWTERPGAPAQISLCGMAVRGTTSSRRIRFIDRSVLIDALKVKCGFQQWRTV